MCRDGKDHFEIDLDQRSRSICKRSRSCLKRSILSYKRSRSLQKDQDQNIDLYNLKDQDKFCDLDGIQDKDQDQPNLLTLLRQSVEVSLW